MSRTRTQVPTARAKLRPASLAAHLLCSTLCIGMFAVPAAVQAQTAAVNADVPAGPLADTLNRFALQAGVSIVVDADRLKDKRAPALKGTVTVDEGFRRLLQGSGYRLDKTKVGYVLVTAETARTENEANPGAMSETTLPAIQVSANADPLPGQLPPAYAGGQLARGGSLGLLGTNDAMDVPFSTASYTSALLEDQQARTLADVVVNDASVRTLTATGGFGEDFQIRGFTVPSGDVGLNGLYGLVSANRMPTEIVERVEVLKGPGALVNGIAPGGSIGGGINVVTKRAADKPLTRLTASYIGKSQFGTHLDVGRRFGTDNVWGVRFNGVVRNGEGSIDNGDQKLGVAALGLDFRGEKLRWSLDAFTQHEDSDEVRPQIGFRAGLTALPAPPSSDLNFYPGNPLKLRNSAVATRVEYDINDSITAYAGLGYRDGAADQVFPVTTTPRGADANGDFFVRSTYYDTYIKTTSADAGLRARFDTAGIRHALTLGVSHLEYEEGFASVEGSPPIPSNIYNPTPLPAVGAPRQEPTKTSDTTLSSVAIADTLSFADDRLLLTLGLRDQTVEVKPAGGDNYKASAVAPLAGIVFKPIENVSVYGNYTKGLTRGRIVGPGYANTGEVLSPYKSDQYEAGVKVDWGNVVTSASLFQISRPNAQEDIATHTYGYSGEQRNRGLELSAYGEPLRGLRVMASAAFNNAKLTRTQGGTNDGNDAPGVPERTFNLGVDWDTPWVAGLSLNGRVINTSSTAFDAANTVRVDGWTRVDVGARYRTRMAGKAVVLRANIENLFDKNYWLLSSPYASVSAPRTLMLSATIDF